MTTEEWGGVAVPFDYVSVDTDAMFPVSAEDTAARDGYGAALFGRWRQDPGFILNRPEYAAASVLVAGPQFGIGSSRETAVWALAGAGFTTVLAPSFGEIFRTNCVRNRVLTGVVAQETVDRLHAWLREHVAGRLRVDLRECRVSTEDGRLSAPFEVDGFARRSLLDGIDELGLLADRADRIAAVLAETGRFAPDTGDVVKKGNP